MLLAIGTGDHAAARGRARAADGRRDGDRRRGHALGGRGRDGAAAGARARAGWCCRRARRGSGRGADGAGVGGGARTGRRRRELAGPQHHVPVRHLPAQPARVRDRTAAATPCRTGSRSASCSTRGGPATRSSQYFIKKYGGQVALAAPIDRGFNRLAWLFPYSLGVVAAGGLGYGAYRCRRRARRRRRRPADRAGRSPTASSPTSSTTSSGASTEPSRRAPRPPSAPAEKPRDRRAPAEATAGARDASADLAPRRSAARPLALGFGALVEKMHFGPPLVMVALGGMTLALTGAALVAGHRSADRAARTRRPTARRGRGGRASSSARSSSC